MRRVVLRGSRCVAVAATQQHRRLLLASLLCRRPSTPVNENPLARWSEDLSWPLVDANDKSQLDVVIGLEGCNTALNATNAIRTALCFGSRQPPHFLSVQQLSDIQSLQQRTSTKGSGGSQIAICGREIFDVQLQHTPLSIFENFIPGAISLHAARLSSPSVERRLLIGHENFGVSASYFSPSFSPRADVVYIPQYGTISSVNVVVCLGIGLFYYRMDLTAPHARTLLGRETSACMSEVRDVVADYERVFTELLPRASASTGSTQSGVLPPAVDRADLRPLHPLFYGADSSKIAATYHSYLEALSTVERSRSHGGWSTTTLHRSLLTGRPLFGVSVLYENNFDQRNFGGLLRNANAFLADHVFYLGRKKVNIVGAVGCQHYSRPVYLGPSSAPIAPSWVMERVRGVLPTPIISVDVWFLSCGHEWLYTTAADGDASCGSEGCSSYDSTADSLRAYETLARDGVHVELHTWTETELREVFCPPETPKHHVLVVPQEGKLPHASILQLCKGIVRVAADDNGSAVKHRGLPSQVASGVALQRLFSILHPHLRW